MDVNKLCPHCMRELEIGQTVCSFCGRKQDEMQDNPHALKPYTILQGKYLVGDVIGEGGFGITYIGFDMNLEMKLAIKEFYPNGFVTRESDVTSMVTNYTTSNNNSQYQKWKDSFVKEARNLAKFSDLPGIVHVRDFFQENNTAYIVMEYVEGETLKDYLASRGGRISVEETLEMMKPVIQSLSKVHAEGMVHRDISPDNIMIEEGGSVKLIDFGAARDFGSGDEKSLSVLLKPGYAPEEQYRSRGNQGPWTDVYAMCATIYRCITGEKPTEAMERMRQDDLKNPSSYGIDITPQIENTLLKGLEIYAENRLNTMDELESLLYGDGKLPDVSAKPFGAKGKTEGIKGARIKINKKTIMVGVAALMVCMIVVIVTTAARKKQAVKPTIDDAVSKNEVMTDAQTETVKYEEPPAATNIASQNVANKEELQDEEEDKILVTADGKYSEKRIRSITFRPSDNSNDAVTCYFDESGNLTNFAGKATFIETDEDGSEKEEVVSLDESRVSDLFFDPTRMINFSEIPDYYGKLNNESIDEGFGNAMLGSYYYTPYLRRNYRYYLQNIILDDKKRIKSAEILDGEGNIQALEYEYNDKEVRCEYNSGASVLEMELNDDGYIEYEKEVNRVMMSDGAVIEDTHTSSINRDSEDRITRIEVVDDCPGYGEEWAEYHSKATTEQQFDGNGNLASRRIDYDDGSREETSYEYDSNNNLISAMTTKRTGENEKSLSLIEFAYEDYGRLNRIDEMLDYEETENGKTGGRSNSYTISYNEEGYPDSTTTDSKINAFIWSRYDGAYLRYLSTYDFGYGFFDFQKYRNSRIDLQMEYEYY